MWLIGRWSAVIFALVGFACGGSLHHRVVDAVQAGNAERALDEYEHYRELDGSNPALLAAIAELVLIDAAIGSDRAGSDAAIHQLALAGSRGTSALEELSRAEGHPLGAARALDILARRGDRHARAALYAKVEDDDSLIRALAVSAANADRDRAKLLEWLEDPHHQVRRAAALVLADGSGAEVRLRLEQAARSDPNPSVREASVRALASFGAPAFEVLRERLSDSSSRVRNEAVRAVVRVGREEGLRLVESLLAGQTSATGIEAARLLATSEERSSSQAQAARLFLRQALSVEQTELRAQAAIALLSLPEAFVPRDALHSALATEADRTVRLGLAIALHQHGDLQGTAALRELLHGDDLAAVQAAVELAAEQEEAAVDRLLRAIGPEADASHRRVAARALARDAHRPDQVRHLLRDQDLTVRIHTAGGLLVSYL